jgi:hypothetical protein
MRRFVLFLLLGGLLVIPAVAQSRGGGLRGPGFIGPGFHADEMNRFPHRGFFQRNGFAGFGIPGYSPDDAVGWDSPGYVYTNSGYGYLSCGPADRNIVHGYGYTPPAPTAPPKVTDYLGPDQTCPQSNGKRLYRIAIPANEPGRNRVTYQDNIWVAHEYWYTEGILNFVTLEGEQKHTPVSSVDRAITLQLNRECDVNFQLPR